jgi:molybdopterin synthase sulfur carrier subunit
MKLRILYFARFRETLGCSEELLEAPAEIQTVAALREYLCRRGAPWSEVLASGKNGRVAVNQFMADETSTLPNGAEVAFFPPVTGG